MTLDETSAYVCKAGRRSIVVRTGGAKSVIKAQQPTVHSTLAVSATQSMLADLTHTSENRLETRCGQVGAGESI